MLTLPLAIALELSSLLKISEERPLLVSFFQEDCEVCRRQFKEYDCLEKSGFHIEIIGIGTDKARLVKLSRKLSRGTRNISGTMDWQTAKALGLQGTPSAFIMRRDAKDQKILGLFACDAKDEKPKSQTSRSSP